MQNKNMQPLEERQETQMYKHLRRLEWPKKLDPYIAGLVMLAMLAPIALYVAMTVQTTTPSLWFQSTFLGRQVK